MELMQLMESIKAEEADVRRIFETERKEGAVSVRQRRRNDPEYLGRVAEVAELLADIEAGRRSPWLLKEAQTTSDFPQLFGDVLDRMLLGTYREFPSDWTQYVKTSTVRDFRTVKRFTVDGAEGVLDAVPEKSVYPYADLADGEFSFAVQKYGRKLGFSWESMINDDLGAFSDTVQRLGRAARRSEAKFVTGLYVDASGPHASLFTAGNKNIVNTTNGAASNNPILGIAGLTDAYKVLSRQVDADGEPIMVSGAVLVVPPALEVVARNILNAIQVEMAEVGGSANQKLIAQNWLAGSISLVVDPYIPIVASSANGHTSWFLFANPNDARPAVEFANLRGHVEPEVFLKSPNAIAVGGGQDPLNGDFDTDAIEYKVRHVFGGGRLDGKAAVASNGSAS